MLGADIPFCYFSYLLLKDKKNRLCFRAGFFDRGFIYFLKVRM